MKKVKVDWDIDLDDVNEVKLPTFVEVPETIEDDDVADWLSDEYGWCVNGWCECQIYKRLKPW